MVNVKARLHFEPAEISTASIQCPKTQTGTLPMVVLTVCFDLAEVTRSKTGKRRHEAVPCLMLGIDPNMFVSEHYGSARLRPLDY